MVPMIMNLWRSLISHSFNRQEKPASPLDCMVKSRFRPLFTDYVFLITSYYYNNILIFVFYLQLLATLPIFVNRDFIARILFYKLLFSDNRFLITIYYHWRMLILIFYLADLPALAFPLNTIFFFITPFQLLTRPITCRAV